MKKTFVVLLLGFFSYFATGQSIYFSNLSFQEAVEESKRSGRKIFVYIDSGSYMIEKEIFPMVSKLYNREYINLRLRKGGDCPNCKNAPDSSAIYYSSSGTLIKGPIRIRSARDLQQY